MDIDHLRACVRDERYEISLHAHKERCAEEITVEEIERAILAGEIIEDYPHDKRGHSCLVLGYVKHKPIHVVCAILPHQWLRIITVYIPEEHKWITPRERRK